MGDDSFVGYNSFFADSSLPRAFVEQQVRLLGVREAEALCGALVSSSCGVLSDLECLGDDFSREEEVCSVRLNPGKVASLPSLSFDGVVPWFDVWGRYLRERPLFTVDPLFHGGAYYVQEASSMFVGWVAEQLMEQGDVVLDLCAAPGGKTTMLASIAATRGAVVVANEVIRARGRVLVENVQKWGTGNVAVTGSDAACFASMGERFDMVFVDAPCSGEGMFRKDVVARQEWSVAGVELCAARQRRVVSDVWGALRVGGVLVYSTCTFNEQENEQNAQWIARELGGEVVEFSSSDANLGVGVGVNGGLFSESGVVAADGGWGYHFYPHLLRGEGLYMVAIRKVAELGGGVSSSRTGRSERVGRGAGRGLELVSAVQRRELERWVLEGDGLRFAVGGGNVYAFSELMFEVVEMLRAAAVNLLYSGVMMGSLIRDQLKVEHSLALYNRLNCENVDVSVVDRETALQYLRKGNLEADGFVHGLSLVEYCGVGLGWIKRIDTRVNNMYPTAWRILRY